MDEELTRQIVENKIEIKNTYLNVWGFMQFSSWIGLT